MFATLLHVALFVAAIIGLLAIKQRRLRHTPTRRTHISRRSAEGTIWLQRAVNAALDMLHSALAERDGAAHNTGGLFPTTSNSSNNKSSSHDNTNKNNSDSSTSGTSPSSTPPAASAVKAAAAHAGDSDSESSTEVPSDLPFLNTLKAQLEEQISSLLEDKGIASFADFRIKDWGGKPPVVKAVCLSHGGGSGGGGSSSGNSNSTTNSNMSGFSNNSMTGTTSSHTNASMSGGGGVGALNGINSNTINNNSINTMNGGSPENLRGVGAGGGMMGGQGLANASSVAGSPNSLGPQLYPSFSGGPSPPSSAINRGGSHAAAASFGHNGSSHGTMNVNNPNNSPNPPLSDGVPPAEVSYASMSGLRFRNVNAGLLSSGEEVGGPAGGISGRERSHAGSMVHPGRMPSGVAGVGSNSSINMNSVNNALNSNGLSTGLGASELASGLGGGAALAASGKHTSDTTRSLSVLEAEAEIEYSGNFSVSLNADIPIARGRYLQVYASVSDVRMLAAHVRLRLALEYEPATVESPQPQPYLLGTLWIVSDPVFDVAFHSSLTQYRIRDFFLIPKLIKLFLLRFLRSRLRPTSSSSSPASSASSASAAARHANARRRRQGAAAAAAAAAAGSNGINGGVVNGVGHVSGGPGINNNSSNSNGTSNGGGQSSMEDGSMGTDSDHTPSDGSGLTFRIQLPPDVVDGGEQWWSAIARDTMSERPAPFLRSYNQ